MRSALAVVAVIFLSCSGNDFCSADTCLGCCTPEGLCTSCPSDGGAAGGAAGGTAGGATAGGNTAGGATAGGNAGGRAGGSTAGGTGTAGGSASCTNGSSCNAGSGANSGICCQNTCKPWATDTQNCGGCGIECPTGSTCTSGRCSVSCDGGTCPGTTQCTTNASGGQLACFPTQCSAVPQYSACARNAPYAGRCCGAACLDTMSDRNNCGYCGTRCTASEDCLWGSCSPRVDCATAPGNSTCPRVEGLGI
jgi:hypothetical protein